MDNYYSGENQSNIQAIIKFVVKGDLEELPKCFEEPTEDSSHAYMNKENINKPCYFGKTLLDTSVMVGNDHVLQELINCGSIPDNKTVTGYTPLHLAACWGNLSCLKLLVQQKVNIDLRTKYGETARQLALRYEKSNCVNYLDFISAKQTLEKYISEVKEKIADPEKMQGVKLTKEEKSSTISACNEKLDWLENNPEAEIHEYLEKKNELEIQIEPVMSKQPPTSTPNTAGSDKK